MNASCEQALAYIAMGWRPIPIPLGKKMPMIMDWPNLQVRQDNVDAYFGDRCNIGVVLGDASGGLVDIDLDSPAAVQLAPLFLPSTMIFGRASKLKSHWVYVSRYARTEKFQGLDGSMLVELRANGGLQTVFPDSVHPSGEAIEWEADFDAPAPLEIKADDIRRVVAQLASAALLISIGWTHDRAVAFAKSPTRAALEGVEEKGVQRISRWLGLEVHAPKPRLHAVPSIERDAIMRRAREYMARVPGAVEGNGGHQQTWDGALNCIRGFALTLSEAREILDEYNGRCDPPWSEKEIDHKLDGIMNADRVGTGWLLEDRRAAESVRKAPNGTSGHAKQPETARTEGAAALDDFPTVIVSAIPDEGPVKWLVQDLWLDQAVGIIGGEPKSYKSFVSAQLAVCVASGKPMFKRHPVTQGRVLMFNAEDRPAMTRGRVHQMCRALDVELSTLDLHMVDVPALRIDDADQVEKLSRTVARLKPALLILDPLRDLHGLDENDAKIVSALLAPLRILQRTHGCSVMLVHHMAKATETQRRPGQRLRGSSALHGWIDSAMYLQLKDGNVQAVAEHRSALAVDPFIFRLQSHEAEDGGEALWLEVQQTEEEIEEADATENKILSALTGIVEPMTMADIGKKTKLRKETNNHAVRSLLNKKLIVEEAVIKTNGITYPAYKAVRQ